MYFDVCKTLFFDAVTTLLRYINAIRIHICLTGFRSGKYLFKFLRSIAYHSCISPILFPYNIFMMFEQLSYNLLLSLLDLSIYHVLYNILRCSNITLLANLSFLNFFDFLFSFIFKLGLKITLNSNKIFVNYSVLIDKRLWYTFIV